MEKNQIMPVKKKVACYRSNLILFCFLSGFNMTNSFSLQILPEINGIQKLILFS